MDWYNEMLMVILFITILFDIMETAYMLNNGLFYEVNPIHRFLLSKGIWYSLAFTISVVSLLFIIGKIFFREEFDFIVICMTMFYLTALMINRVLVLSGVLSCYSGKLMYAIILLTNISIITLLFYVDGFIEEG